MPRTQFIEQAPGPRGSPQLPQGAGDEAKLFSELPTAKLDNCCSRFFPEQDGQRGESAPRTTASKRRSQSLQIYSKIGIGIRVQRTGYREQGGLASPLASPLA